MSLGPGLLGPATPGHLIARFYLLPHQDPESVPSALTGSGQLLSEVSIYADCTPLQGPHRPPSPWHTSVRRPCHREAAVWSVLSWTCLPAGPCLDPSLLPALLLQMVPSGPGLQLFCALVTPH